MSPTYAPGVPISVEATGLPLTIPATGDYIKEAIVPVMNNGAAVDMHVSLWLQITDVYNLQIDLIPPSGSAKSLFWTRAHGANVGAGAAQEDRVHFFDAATDDPYDSFTVGAWGEYPPDVPFTTSFGPTVERKGNWQIRVTNFGSVDAVLRATTLSFGMNPSDVPLAPPRKVRMFTSLGWVELTGPAGPAGPPGPQGPMGAVLVFEQIPEPSTTQVGALWIKQEPA